MKLIKFLFLTLISAITLSCSNSDDSSDLSEAGQNLLGQWYFEEVGFEPNNSFTFDADGTVIYSYWDGSSTNPYEFDEEDGTWSLDGDILTMNFPEGFNLTYIQKLTFENEYKVIFEEVEGAQFDAYSGDYFKDGYVGPKQYMIEIAGESSSQQQYPIEIIYYYDDESGVLQSETVNTQTNTDIINNYTASTYNKIGFEYSVTGYTESTINSVYITDVSSNTIIFSNSNLEVEDNETFMYDISSNSYTIE